MARLPNPAAETTHSNSPARSRARGRGAAATGSGWVTGPSGSRAQAGQERRRPQRAAGGGGDQVAPGQGGAGGEDPLGQERARLGAADEAAGVVADGLVELGGEQLPE